MNEDEAKLLPQRLYAIIESEDLDALREMIEKQDISPDSPTSKSGAGDAYTLLTQAVYLNRLEIVQYLIERGADVNKKDAADWRPVYTAVKKERCDALVLLLENDADPSLNCKGEETAVDIAKDLEKLKKILSHYPKWKKTDDNTIHHRETSGDFHVTSIFNFNSMTVVTVMQDRNTESQSHETRHFSEPGTNKVLLMEAKDELLNREGHIDECHLKQSLQRPAAPAQQRQVSRRK